MARRTIWLIAGALFVVAAIAMFAAGQPVFGGGFLAVGAGLVVFGLVERDLTSSARR